MNRTRLALVAGSLLLALAGTAGSVLWAFFQVPDFYERELATAPPAEVRQQAARQFVRRTMELVSDIRHTPQWSEEFEQDQINGWLAEELHNPKYKKLLPKDVRQPRIALGKDVIRVGFRVQRKGWDGIVSLRVRPWMAGDNELALEIQSVRVGLVPYPLEEALEDVVHRLEANGWLIDWHQANGNEVLIVHLDHGQKPDGPVLENLEVVEGAVRLSGRSGAGNQTRMVWSPPTRSGNIVRVSATDEERTAEAVPPDQSPLRFTRLSDRSAKK